MDNVSDNASEMPADLPWQLLKEITNGFSEEREIGRGGYGVVYKGVYTNGEEIAVKKFDQWQLDDKQFQNELQKLTILRHQNIVRLVGKSYRERERCVEHEGKRVWAIRIDSAICLEYLHNGSLEKHLCDEYSGLSWHCRYKIIKGICDGLRYLHGCGIFHLDLKPANILLDKNMVPKIEDLDLSRLFSRTRQSHTTSKFIGTRGYMPPEYINQGKISNKFDVFSLGVIIIDIMTGPKGYSKQSDMSSQDFIEQVLENWRNRPQEQWKDKSYLDVFFQQVKICIEIALNCVETDIHKRPSIEDIISKLNESETMIEKLDKAKIKNNKHLNYSKKPKLANLRMDNVSDNASEMLEDLPWQLLEEITNGFSKEWEIGRGGFGVVYKGVHRNGEEIAVKKLHHWLLNDKQSQNELQKLTILCHQNIVRLVGKSYEERARCVEHEGKQVCAIMIDRAICLEYLHNGSLENHLCDEYSGLSWHGRYKIIKGICDGLEYLHGRGIFHLDLKPSNILLDKNMVPKIADFDLSRLFSGTRQSHTTSKLIGTRGYMPPEYIKQGKISEKFDVFSLGVIIIGIMTGPKGYSEQFDMSSQDFIEQVLENWRNRPQEQWKHKSYLDAFCQQVKICIEIALNCVETDRHKRPSIEDIISKLNESETMIEKPDKVPRTEMRSLGPSYISREQWLSFDEGDGLVGMDGPRDELVRRLRISSGWRDLRRWFAPIGPMLPTPYEEGADLVIEKLANDGDEQLKVVSVVGMTTLARVLYNKQRHWRDELVRRLSGIGDEQDKLQGVCILGVAGIGKTMLATQVYNQIKSRFDRCVFISASKEVDMARLCRSILLQLQETINSNGRNDVRYLIYRVRTNLEDKRFLIVIDGVWFAQIVEDIKVVLPENSRGSRIITTSGISDVAESCGKHFSSFIYRMKPLTFEESLGLFRSIIFGSGRSCPVASEKVDEEIVKACGGIPLALRLIAGALASKPAEMEQWVTFREIMKQAGTDDHLNVEWMRKIFDISYSDLSCDMKACLLYLSAFPENHVIRKDCLITRWVAEGFLLKRRGKTWWETGESYFLELVARNLVNPVYDEEDVLPIGCKVSGSVHDFITSLSVTHPTCIQHGVFRRVLDLKDNKRLENEQLESIGRLSLLSYLGLGGTNVTELPQQIMALEQLTTLDIRRTGVRKLPAFRDTKLVFLLADELIIPKEMGGMQKLEELSEVLMGPDGSLADDVAGLVNKLRRLRMLGVTFSRWYAQNETHQQQVRVLDLKDNKRLENEQLESIGRLSLLRYLGLGGTSVTKLPQQIMALEQLTTLDIRRTRVRKLPAFRDTKLVFLLADELIIPTGMGGMQKLEELSKVLMGPDGSVADDVAGLVNQLRMLGVRFSRWYAQTQNETHQQEVKHFVEEVGKSNLQSLFLDNYPHHLLNLLVDSWAHKRPHHLREIELRIRVSVLPKEMASLIALTHLHINVEEVEAQGVRALGNLPNLVLLKLVCSDTGVPRLAVSSKDGFQCLKVFCYWSGGGGMGLQFEAGAMPQLRRLVLYFNVRETISEYGDFDFGVEHLSYLVQVRATMDCLSATAWLVEAAEANMRYQVSQNPNHPVLLHDLLFFQGNRCI